MKLFTSFVRFIRGKTFDSGEFLELSNAFQIDEADLALLSVAKKQYDLSQTGTEGKCYEQMKTFLSSCEDVSKRSHFLSMLPWLVVDVRTMLRDC